MRFYKSKSRGATLSYSYPCVVLTTSEWDDYSYRTSFQVSYFPSMGVEKEIGNVKILRKTYDADFEENALYRYTCEYMEGMFEGLDGNFCSLGQSLDYYFNLKRLGDRIASQILQGLNDVAVNEEIRTKFKHLKGFQDSLIRYSYAEKAMYEAKQFFGKEIQKLYDFTFVSKLDKATDSHEIKFDFRENNSLPFRINVLIGKNGTGKTQIMARLANALSGYNVENQGDFRPSRRPSFGQVIAFSYSVFDEFERPPEGETTYSYKYCGLRDSEGNIYDKDQLSKRFYQSYDEIKGTDKEKYWKEVLDVVVEREHSSIIDELKLGNINVEDMSSGQRILVTIITEVIESIDDDSILLIDEPELHLHPNAISNFYRMLYMLLEKFKSFAIISTHSPIIIQETPSSYINVFERIENSPIVRKLDVESFGENLSIITDKVFGVTDEESNYKQWLKLMSEKEDFNDVLSKFEGKLSLNSIAYLASLYSERK
ncbi:AAA family ATPase [Bacillus cereus]|uniref:AAA family ATPase n=1 Tax=Bacillus cereus TaxID=1396 RepID=UPI00159BAFE5|nr:AAA family ATPase [Bacillus cereus]